MSEAEENYNTSSSFDSSSELSSGSGGSLIENNIYYENNTDTEYDFESDSSETQDKVQVEDENLFDSKYRHEISNKITSALSEMVNDSQFQTLIDQTTVNVSTSIDPAHPFCFRIRADFPNQSPVSAFAFFSNVSSRPEWDSMCESIEVLKVFDELTCIYHLKLKKKWPATARDSLMFSAFRKLKDGRFVSVAWSIEDDNLCPPDSSASFIRMSTRISANLFEPRSSGEGFVLTQLIDGDPKGNIPSYVVKSVSAKAFPSTISSIKAAILPNENFYTNIINEKTKRVPESKSKSELESDKITNSHDRDLEEIMERLNQIDLKLSLSLKTKSSDNSSNNFLKWTPLVLSTCSLLFLVNLNINLRKK